MGFRVRGTLVQGQPFALWWPESKNLALGTFVCIIYPLVFEREGVICLVVFLLDHCMPTTTLLTAISSEF